MKVYISADIEGVCGVTHFDEATLSKEESRWAREQMTAEVAAACEGALQAGAKEVWVKDAHDTGRNIMASKLPEGVRLVRGWSRHPMMMMQELDATFDAAVMIGYHSRASAAGNPLSHTMSGGIVHLLINGQPSSEFLINSYAAATQHVPVALVSGDQGLCDDVKQLNSHITTVAVKQGVGASTVNIHPATATTRIKDGVFSALRGDLRACQVPLPGHFTVEIKYRDHSQAYVGGFFPGARQVEPTTIAFDCDEYFEVLRLLLFVL